MMEKVTKATRQIISSALPVRLKTNLSQLIKTPGLLPKLELLLVTFSSVMIAMANQLMLAGHNI
jgi:hypothetical protein